MTTDRLFGSPDARFRPGHADTEWAVWISGMDDVLDAPDLETASRMAVERNAAFADLCFRDPQSPALYAVVLHHGYAWTQATEHAHGVHGGISACGHCASSAPSEG